MQIKPNCWFTEVILLQKSSQTIRKLQTLISSYDNNFIDVLIKIVPNSLQYREFDTNETTN